jgi:peroxiredoxin
MRYLVIVLVLATAFAAWLYFTPKQKKVGESADAFILNTATGRVVDTEKLAGKCKCLVFFSTDDEESRVMLSQFRYVTDHFRGNANVRFLAIAVNGTKERVPLFMSQYAFPGDVLLDGDGSVAALYRVSTLPAVFVVDADDQIAFSVNGWRRDNIREINPILRKTAGS